MRRRAFGLALTVTVVASAGAAPSWAQTTGDILVRPGGRGHIALYGIFTASPQDRALNTIHVAAQVAAGVRLNSWLLATTDVTSAWTTFRIESEARRSAFRFGNPFVTVQAALLEEQNRSIYAGVGVAPPVTTFPGTIPENTEVEYNYAVATAARGFADYWMWAPNAIPIALLLRSRAELSMPVIVGAELDPAVLVSVNANPSRLAVVAAAHAGLRMGPLTPGVRVQMLAQSAPLAGRDFSQWAATLYANVELEPVFVRSQVAVNLDAPSGVAGQRGATTWGVSLGGGVHL